MRAHDIGVADRAADNGFVKHGPDFGQVWAVKDLLAGHPGGYVTATE